MYLSLHYSYFDVALCVLTSMMYALVPSVSQVTLCSQTVKSADRCATHGDGGVVWSGGPQIIL